MLLKITVSAERTEIKQPNHGIPHPGVMPEWGFLLFTLHQIVIIILIRFVRFSILQVFLRIPHFFQLEAIEITLRSQLNVGCVVVSLLRPDVQNQTDGEQVEIRDRNPDLHAPQQKQRRGQLTLGRSQFFLAFTSVNRFAPQRSRISGSTS